MTTPTDANGKPYGLTHSRDLDAAIAERTCDQCGTMHADEDDARRCCDPDEKDYAAECADWDYYQGE